MFCVTFANCHFYENIAGIVKSDLELALPQLIKYIYNSGTDEVIRRGKKIHSLGYVELLEHDDLMNIINFRICTRFRIIGIVRSINKVIIEVIKYYIVAITWIHHSYHRKRFLVAYNSKQETFSV